MILKKNIYGKVCILFCNAISLENTEEKAKHIYIKVIFQTKLIISATCRSNCVSHYLCRYMLLISEDMVQLFVRRFF